MVGKFKIYRFGYNRIPIITYTPLKYLIYNNKKLQIQNIYTLVLIYIIININLICKNDSNVQWL